MEKESESKKKRNGKRKVKEKDENIDEKILQHKVFLFFFKKWLDYVAERMRFIISYKSGCVFKGYIFYF